MLDDKLSAKGVDPRRWTQIGCPSASGRCPRCLESGGPRRAATSLALVATSIESVLVAAARNNAEWCALMSRTHGVAGEFDEQAWAAAARTPPYYPDAVTLMPDCDPDALMARIDTALPSASVKDSFADLDLTGSGFEVLFDAQWIHRAATKPFVRSDLEWSVVVDAGALGRWALAWDDGKGNEGVFQPQLLDDPDTFVVAG